MCDQDSVEADRNVAFVSTNSLQSKFKITINLILGAKNNINSISFYFQLPMRSTAGEMGQVDSESLLLSYSVNMSSDN